MSVQSPKKQTDDEKDPWEKVAEHRETFEMLIEEDVAFAQDAERILERLEEEGY